MDLDHSPVWWMFAFNHFVMKGTALGGTVSFNLPGTHTVTMSFIRYLAWNKMANIFQRIFRMNVIVFQLIHYVTQDCL